MWKIRHFLIQHYHASESSNINTQNLSTTRKTSSNFSISFVINASKFITEKKCTQIITFTMTEKAVLLKHNKKRESKNIFNFDDYIFRKKTEQMLATPDPYPSSPSRLRNSFTGKMMKLIANAINAERKSKEIPCL